MTKTSMVLLMEYSGTKEDAASRGVFHIKSPGYFRPLAVKGYTCPPVSWIASVLQADMFKRPSSWCSNAIWTPLRSSGIGWVSQYATNVYVLVISEARYHCQLEVPADADLSFWISLRASRTLWWLDPEPTLIIFLRRASTISGEEMPTTACMVLTVSFVRQL